MTFPDLTTAPSSGKMGCGGISDFALLIPFIPRFPGGSMVKNPAAKQETQVWSLNQEHPLEKEMATHSSILVWEIPWTEEPGGLQCMGSRRIGHDWAHTHAFYSGATQEPGNMNSESELIKWMVLGDSMIRGLLFAPQLKIGVLLNPLVFCLSFAPCKLEQLDL